MGVRRLGKAPAPRSQRPGAMSDDANRGRWRSGQGGAADAQ